MNLVHTLTIEGLAAERGGRLVFSGISFSLGSGQALCVVGRNGAGKSTLLRVIAGLLRQSAGTVRLESAETPPDDEPPVAERVHYLGHADAIKGALTAIENLTVAAAIAGGRALDPAEALRRFGLSHAEDLPTAYLSAGQRRRLALARLTVAHRPLWLLDEPATALDRTSQAMLTDTLRRHLAQGGLVVAATHAPLGLDRASELRLGPDGG